MTPVADGSGRARGFAAGDLWGGAAAAAVVLPQAMAFGVSLLAPSGLPAAQGALVGLLGAAVLCAASGLLGGTIGLISAPTGPTLVLLGGALASLAAAGLHGPDLLAGLAATLVLTGLFQIVIGASGGGRLVKFIPYPVVSGFMTGSALLMIKSELTPLSGEGFDAAWEHWRWLPAATAGATYAFMHYVPRFVRFIPGTIAGLVGGTALFQLVAWLGPGTPPPAWLIGALPDITSMRIGLSLDGIRSLPFGVVVTAALALALLASLDTLLTAVIADVATGARHESRRELIGQGIGQLGAGLIGAMGGAGTTGATVVAIKTGGRRWVGLVAGLTFLLLVVAGGGIGRVLPIGVLAGIILHVAVHMLERDIFAWARRRRTRMDAVIALVVTATTVAYDLMVAVGAGVAIALILFVRAQVRAAVVHRRSTARQVRSVRVRPEEERDLLDAHGDRIVLYELRGNLFFATAERLFEELLPDLEQPNWVILHLRRVRQVDLTGAKILQQIAARLHRNGGELIFCNVYREIGLGHRVTKTLKKISPATRVKVKTVAGSDEALEYAEDALLVRLGHPPSRATQTVPLALSALCRGMREEDIAALEAVMHPCTVARKAKVFASGDFGQGLYVVRRGEVDIRLPTTRHHSKRLARYGPGSFFGELALLAPGRRTAHAVALRKTELLVLEREDFDRLAEEHERSALAVLMALARVQVEHQRWSTAEIQRLAEW